jgi:hypothetical protein
VIVTLTIALAIYALNVWRGGSAITPDGAFYLASGRGEATPMPYALRYLPQAIRSLAGWRAMHVGSYLALIVATFAAVHHVSAAHATPAALTLAVLPSIRQSTTWPVLLDMPHWATIAVAVALAQVNPALGFAVCVWSVFITERTPIFAALAAGPWLPCEYIVASVALSVVWVLAMRIGKPYLDTDIDWLQHPIRTALAKHRTSKMWSWWLPWGGAVVALPHLSAWALAMVAVAYGQCLVAQDRARLYTTAALPVVLSLTSIDPVALYAVAVITYLTPITEV